MSVWSAALNATVPSVVVAANSSATVTTTPTLKLGAVVLSLIVVATAFGNVLLCVAVATERRLQNMTNYFLASLAVADLLVAVVVMPLAVVVQIYGICCYTGYGVKVDTHCPYVRAVYGKKALHAMLFSVRTGGVDGTPILVARNFEISSCIGY